MGEQRKACDYVIGGDCRAEPPAEVQHLFLIHVRQIDAEERCFGMTSITF